MNTAARSLTFSASSSAGDVGALLVAPAEPRAVLVFAHGAGAGMRHPFMESVATRLAERNVATFRYEFAYMSNGRGRPDPQPVLLATVRSAVARAAAELPGVALFAGGKSMGGRMTSLSAAASPLDDVRGIVFFGFPLHPAGSPGTARADHLRDVSVPMLFLQGTRDALAPLATLEPIVRGLGERARLRIEDGADHGFHVLKRSGRTDEQVLDALADAAAAWCVRNAVG